MSHGYKDCTSFSATIFYGNKADPSRDARESCLEFLLDRVNAIEPIITKSHRFLDLGPQPRVAEMRFTFSRPYTLQKLRRDPSLSSFEAAQDVQIVIQIDNVFRRYKRLAVFDMDSTLIQQEVIDEIARQLGVEAQVSAITERAMNGELDFSQSLRERCALLKGVPSTVFEDLKHVITLTPGAADLVKGLKRLGFKTAVLSGGFSPLTSWLAQQLGLDYAHANHLVESEDGLTLTGQLSGIIVDGEKKRELLRTIATEHNLIAEQVLAIGDGANDLPMLWAADLGVGFNAKAQVQKEAPVKLNSASFLDILYLLGLTSQEQKQLLV